MICSKDTVIVRLKFIKLNFLSLLLFSKDVHLPYTTKSIQLMKEMPYILCCLSPWAGFDCFTRGRLYRRQSMCIITPQWISVFSNKHFNANMYFLYVRYTIPSSYNCNKLFHNSHNKFLQLLTFPSETTRAITLHNHWGYCQELFAVCSNKCDLRFHINIGA